MKKQSIENLKAVRDEACGMLDNIRAVKGDQHALIVRALLMAANASELVAFLIKASDAPEDAAEALLQSHVMCLHGMIAFMQRAGGISPQLMSACLDDADSLGNSVDGLMRQAVHLGEVGSPFGGGSAQ